MHGVKKALEAVSLVERQQQEEDEKPQIEHFKKLVTNVLMLRNAKEFDAHAGLKVTGELLLLNPDFMTAWNLRKEILLSLLRNKKCEELIKEEFEFGVAAIKVNPKSYGAWYHRKWLITKLHDFGVHFGLAAEIKLCSKLLDLDSRNFHCWNYRWFLFQTFNVSVQEEFDFTTQMIYKNFSNYSAWHRRSLLFPMLVDNLNEEQVRKAIISDLKLIKSAYFTEPADQSCWFYLRWIIYFGTRWFEKKALLEQELDNINELLVIEPEAPLALYTWVNLAKELGLASNLIEPKLEILKRVDPLRIGMYNSLLSNLTSNIPP